MRVRTLAGIVLVLIGAVQFGLSGYVVFDALQMEAKAEESWKRNDRRCINALEDRAYAAGGIVNVTTNFAEVRMLDLPDWRTAMEEVSAVIAYCSTRELTYFCIGSTCDGRAPAEEGSLPEPPIIHFHMTRKERT